MSKKQGGIIRRRIAGSYLSSLASLSMVLLLVGVSALLLLGIPSVEDHLADNLKLTLILKKGTSAENGVRLKDRIAMQPYVHSARYVSVQEGEKELAELLGPDFLDSFEASPVPSSIELSLSRDYLVPDSVAVVKSRLYSLSPSIEEVNYPAPLASSLSSGLGRLALTSLAVAAVLLFISIVLISSTLRLGLYSNRLTIHTMLLVGASRSFVAGPYVRKAVLEGIFASCIAVSLIALALYPAFRNYPDLLSLFSPISCAIAAVTVFVFAILVCLLSSEILLGKVMRLDNDELYG